MKEAILFLFDLLIYIVRLVFDRDHRSLALAKRGVICGDILPPSPSPLLIYSFCFLVFFLILSRYISAHSDPRDLQK